MGGLSMEHPWAFAFGLLGNVISFSSLLAPIPTFYRIFKSKSTEGFQSVPYVVALFSAMLWIFYALVKTGEGLLISINAAGCVIETVYIVMYLVYADRKAKIFTAKIVVLLNIAGFGLIFLLTLFAFHGETRVVSLGWICVGFSVCVFVAPLSIIGRVIKTKSVEYMPFTLSLTLTLSAIVWFLYGLLIKDKYVALPNILGFTFGVIQMVLYVFYMNKTPVASQVKEGKEAWKAPAEDHVVVINVGKADKSSCAEVRPVTEMAGAVDVPRRCAAEAAAAPGVDFARSVNVV
ncbi:bidirectional sugar transporter SWEET13 [Aegilops tauschii subsp. strangulata]|uniref:Bidirectional sugar transporter SWEET n=2 Tax=Triticinae TaxID=1648030 RepID=A0A453Q0I9_AEGTS|nr:bidirectional sugar transporter SWEET13 [Aegilops tauschii subsp. strangulata]XP_044421610.1 bidirectional sugar transporter SWEET13-like [Triticum aestivum]